MYLVTQYVFQRSNDAVRGSALTVLLALADYANKEGQTQPTRLDVLAAKARISVRSLQRHLVTLRDAGEAVGILVDGVGDERSYVFSLNGFRASIGMSPIDPTDSEIMSKVVHHHVKSGQASTNNDMKIMSKVASASEGNHVKSGEHYKGISKQNITGNTTAANARARVYASDVDFSETDSGDFETVGEGGFQRTQRPSTDGLSGNVSGYTTQPNPPVPPPPLPTAPRPNVYAAWERHFGPLTFGIGETLIDAVDEYGEQPVLDAIAEAGPAKPYSPHRYVLKILDRRARDAQLSPVAPSTMPNLNEPAGLPLDILREMGLAA